MAEIKNNTYKIDKNDLDKIKKNFISEMLDENETIEMIKTIKDEYQMVVDPHTAVGIGAVRKLGLEKNCVVLSTAHPCKFPKAIEDAIFELKKQIISNRNLGKPGEIEEPSSNFTKEEYKSAVKKAKAYINQGDIFQVVLSQRFETKLTKKPLSIYKRLRLTNPSPFMFYFNFNDFQIIGASPEILVRLRDNKVTIRPIAGTRPRGKNLSEDNFYKKDLLSDKKEISEHLMLLDLGRNDIGKISKINTVKVTEQFKIEKYSHVMHIVSNVTGEFDKKKSKYDTLMAGFPAGTVSGAPKIRAMEIIDELEKNKRKIYAGGIGYFSANGDFDTCIALRTALAKNGKYYVQAGAGIVADSVPEKEFQETVNKSKALIKALD